MKNAEAIDILRHIGGSYGDVSKYHTAVNMAISALEKQVGKKPKIVPNEFQKYEEDEWNDYLCPKCGRTIISKHNGQWFCGKRQHFCDLCGQRIDWSDEK